MTTKTIQKVIGYGFIGFWILVAVVISRKKPEHPPTATIKTEVLNDGGTKLEVEIKVVESPWHKKKQPDAMGRDRWFAWAKSTNTVAFSFPYGGDQRGQLMVRSTDTEIKDILFSIERGQFSCKISNCYIAARFDDGAIRRFSVSDPDDHSTTVKFINNYQGFLAALRKAKQVRIEASFYEQGNHTLTFNTAGFDW